MFLGIDSMIRAIWNGKYKSERWNSLKMEINIQNRKILSIYFVLTKLLYFNQEVFCFNRPLVFTAF